MPGRLTTYTIVVTNTGPSPVTAASVTDLFPVALVAPAWTCTADPGSSCAAASGTGNLATTVTLEAGDRATFTVTGLIAANADRPARQHGDRHGAGRAPSIPIPPTTRRPVR